MFQVYESRNTPFSGVTAKHTVSPAEERAFVDWINRMLGADMDLVGHLPINAQIDGQLYERCRDGLLICKLINFAVPNTIDERCINKPPFTRSVFKANENLMLAVNSAESIGCCIVNVGPEDIANCSRHLVLGLIWQIIRIGLLSVISLSHHAELACLLSPGECLDDLRLLSPEDLLIRWVNYHLERAGITHRYVRQSSVAAVPESLVSASLDFFTLLYYLLFKKNLGCIQNILTDL
ncbi:phospholipid scramblase 1 [Cichlidogyrus casuarinus]|uniref:Phospholipid scramblase 1 n=1 Tax=Cichlidogyrus casuarinus TaxID=1844966 RepID=A0ABD2Q9X8_9PLAT